MSMTGSTFASNSLIRGFLVNPSQRLKQTLFFNPFWNLAITRNNNGRLCNFQGEKRLHYLGTTMRERKDFAVFNSMLPGVPIPSGPPSSSWRSWVVGIALTIVLPFFTHKWGPLLQIKKEIDRVVETAEQIVDVVENVAEKLEKVAEDIAHDLPEGGVLRNTVDFVEDVAETIAKDAHLAAEFIDKVEVLEEKLESFMEPAIHQTKDADEDASEQEQEQDQNEENKLRNKTIAGPKFY